MFRAMLAWSVVVLVAMTAGCRMCAHPYDYCRPTYTGQGCGDDCLSDTREGSILSYEMQPIADSEITADMFAPVPGSMVEISDETAEPAILASR